MERKPRLSIAALLHPLVTERQTLVLARPVHDLRRCCMLPCTCATAHVSTKALLQLFSRTLAGVKLVDSSPHWRNVMFVACAEFHAHNNPIS